MLEISSNNAAHTNSPHDAMLHTAAQPPKTSADSTLGRAHRRNQGAKRLLALRRAQLGDRLGQIVAEGPCTDAGPRYLLAQSVGAVDRPVWAFLSIADAATGQLVFSGNRRPVEFSEPEAVELAPLLGVFVGTVEFRPVAGVLA